MADTDMDAWIRERAGHGQPVEDQAEPEAEQDQPTDFDGAARTSAPRPPSMNDQIRRAAGVIR
jgi:hypothetical protein